MASFFPSITRQTGCMLIATAQRRRMLIICICLLLLAGGSSARSHQSCGKKELVFYDFEDDVPPDVTAVIAASPSRSDILAGIFEFGTIIVIDNPLRTGFANDSTQLGRLRGPLIFEKDLSFSVSLTLELTTPGCTGTLTTQGTLDQKGNGELAITGGTGAYRFVRGYAEFLRLTPEPINFIYKLTIHLKYF